MNKPKLDPEHMDFLLAAQDAVSRAIADHESAAYWKTEADEWRDKYTDLLNAGIRHSGETTASLLKCILAGSIVVLPTTPSEGVTDGEK